MGLFRHVAAVALWSLLAAGVAHAGAISLRTEDGVALHAVEYGTGTKGVLLVHGEGRSAEDWSYFAGRLASSGFHVLAVDLRGHGTNAAATLADADYLAMTGDVKAALGWFRKKGVSSVHVIGAELGANLTLAVAVEDTAIASIILLSPGLNYHGLKIGEPMVAYGARPALIVASNDDEYGARSARFLEAKGGGGTRVEYVAGDASGTRMLNRSPDVEGSIVAWLNGTHHLTGDQDRARSLETGTQTQLDTQGVKFGGDE